MPTIIAEHSSSDPEYRRRERLTACIILYIIPSLEPDYASSYLETQDFVALDCRHGETLRVDEFSILSLKVGI
jgi:hypothetical protein